MVYYFWNANCVYKDLQFFLKDLLNAGVMCDVTYEVSFYY